jgi:hypothetical protein
MDILINQALANTNFNIFLALLLALVTGQLIRPVPRIISELIENYFWIKYFILVLIGCRLFNPLDNKKIGLIFIFAFVLLYSLEILRKYD